MRDFVSWMQLMEIVAQVCVLGYLSCWVPVKRALLAVPQADNIFLVLVSLVDAMLVACYCIATLAVACTTNCDGCGCRYGLLHHMCELHTVSIVTATCEMASLAACEGSFVRDVHHPPGKRQESVLLLFVCSRYSAALLFLFSEDSTSPRAGG